jgi:prepilin-type N-terminal cleavage/methylation domain-containing protein
MKRGQRGFTLIELMVALVVSSLLVGMILAIFSRMSIAYRGQQQIAGVQQVLAAARAAIEFDAKQAGLAMPQGFIYNDGLVHQAVSVTNSSTGPDQVAFFYADPSAQAAVTAPLPGGWGGTFHVDSAAAFAVGNVVVVSTADLTTVGLNATTDGNIAKYSACVVRIASIAASPPGDNITFSTTPPWNTTYCNSLPVPSATTMIYLFAARGYRVDTSNATRAAIGPLQQSLNGGLLGVADTWVDLAYGFTDLQTSLQAYHGPATLVPPPGDTLDLDTDPLRDWYSDGLQDTLTLTKAVGVAPTLVTPDGLLQISISLVARTDRNVEGIATSSTPALIDPVRPANNTLGDHPAVALPSATDPALQGARIYRYTTFQVDFRNLGVGR